MNKFFQLVTCVSIVFAFGCDKASNLEVPSFNDGNAPTISLNTTNLAAFAVDSQRVVFISSWTNPGYDGVNASTLKYVVEIDSATKNFKNPVRRTIIGKRSDSLTAKMVNDIMLNNFGYTFNVQYDMEFRVIASLGNNNQQFTSNVVRAKITPYKIPPIVSLPVSDKLFIVGGAAGSWNNPVAVPNQELTKIDETTWGGIINFVGGDSYLLLPTNGSWSTKYSITNSPSNTGAGGTFGFNLNDNLPGPSAAGPARLTVDFQSGKYSVVALPSSEILPTNLFMVGGATLGGWSNPVPVPSQQFTRTSNSAFTLTLPMTNDQFLLLPTNGDWSNKFAVTNPVAATFANTGGTFKYNGPDNFPAPTVAGNYKFDFNFFTYSYKVTKL